MGTNDPIAVQKQIRDNVSDLQSYLSDLSSWDTNMKAKELADSSADLEVLYLCT